MIICPRLIWTSIDGLQESITNRINVTGFEPDTVKLMLDFLYTGDYSIPGPPEVDEEASIPADPPEGKRTPPILCSKG